LPRLSLYCGLGKNESILEEWTRKTLGHSFLSKGDHESGSEKRGEKRNILSAYDPITQNGTAGSSRGGLLSQGESLLGGGRETRFWPHCSRGAAVYRRGGTSICRNKGQNTGAKRVFPSKDYGEKSQPKIAVETCMRTSLEGTFEKRVSCTHAASGITDWCLKRSTSREGKEKKLL